MRGRGGRGERVDGRENEGRGRKEGAGGKGERREGAEEEGRVWEQESL